MQLRILFFVKKEPFENYRNLGVSDSTVGPAVLEIVNNLLKHLERSVALGRKYEEPGSRAMQCYQAALLRAMVGFHTVFMCHSYTYATIYLFSNIMLIPLLG